MPFCKANFYENVFVLNLSALIFNAVFIQKLEASGWINPFKSYFFNQKCVCLSYLFYLCIMWLNFCVSPSLFALYSCSISQTVQDPPTFLMMLFINVILCHPSRHC